MYRFFVYLFEFRNHFYFFFFWRKQEQGRKTCDKLRGSKIQPEIWNLHARISFVSAKKRLADIKNSLYRHIWILIMHHFCSYTATTKIYGDIFLDVFVDFFFFFITKFSLWELLYWRILVGESCLKNTVSQVKIISLILVQN